MHGRAAATEGMLGWTPRYQDLDWRGLKFSETEFDNAMTTNRDEWVAELASHDELFFKLYKRLPGEFPAIRDLLLARFWRKPKEAGGK